MSSGVFLASFFSRFCLMSAMHSGKMYILPSFSLWSISLLFSEPALVPSEIELARVVSSGRE